MPRRYATYPEKFTIFHEISTIGAYVMAVGLVLALANLLHSLLRGQRAPANPWGANSLEWHCPSPPPHDNFTRTPEASDPYDYHRWTEQSDGSWEEGPEDPNRPKPAH
jgi:cytochrome c oxidase subunit 1